MQNKVLVSSPSASVSSPTREKITHTDSNFRNISAI